MVVGVYGDIPENTEEIIEKSFGSLKEGLPADKEISQEPLLKEDRSKIVETDKKAVAGIFIGYPGVRFTDTEEAAVLDVIDAMTSGVGYPGGWLHNKLRGEKLVYVVHAMNVTGLDPGYFGIYAGCDPENVDKALVIIHREMGRLAKGDFTDKELDKARELCILGDKLQHQTIGSFAFTETLNVIYGFSHDFHEGYAERIRSVSKDDILRMADKRFMNKVTVITIPKKKK